MRTLQAVDLVTTDNETRDGFINMALEKNRISSTYVNEANNIFNLCLTTNSAEDLLSIPALQEYLLTAAGVSEKAARHFTSTDKGIAIERFVDEYLIPSGEKYVAEFVFRYLLIKGDSVGGVSRNLAGVFAQRTFRKYLLGTLQESGLDAWVRVGRDSWTRLENSSGRSVEETLDICWSDSSTNRTRRLIFNKKINLIGKNVDLVLINSSYRDTPQQLDVLLRSHSNYIALGEIKGGVDPAGSDEHWKTAVSALNRINSSFRAHRLNPHTFFIGYSIVIGVAAEIKTRLSNNDLTCAANLTKRSQMEEICRWLISV